MCGSMWIPLVPICPSHAAHILGSYNEPATLANIHNNLGRCSPNALAGRLASKWSEDPAFPIPGRCPALQSRLPIGYAARLLIRSKRKATPS
ncbi:hypothetical protein BJX96DRAFT_147571 [Aspergillus floccosus]